MSFKGEFAIRIRVAGLIAVALLSGMLSGCESTFTIRLDPGAEDAAVYVNGELLGNGISRHEVKVEFDYPQSFVAKVVPAKDSEDAYRVEIAREFDWIRVLTTVGPALASSGVLVATQYLQVRDRITGPTEAITLLLTPWSPGMYGAIFLLTAPMTALKSFRYKEYYDLGSYEKARPKKPK